MKTVKRLFVYVLPLFSILIWGCPSDNGNGSEEPETTVRADGKTADLQYIAENSKKAGDGNVVVHELGDPDKLNPLLSSSANSTYIEYNIFYALLDYDPATVTLRGMLAVDRPVIEEITEGEYAGGLTIKYEIRPEATWDNGDPVLASDYIFTLKAMKNPKVSADNIRPYLEFIDHVKVDPENPKKFTVYAKEKYIMAEEYSAYYIYPEYVYDPEGIMRKFTIKELNNEENRNSLLDNADINAFAEQFNSPKFSREKGFVVGSGPYEFEEWETGQRIVLKKKENWWGDKVAELPAYPEKIEYKMIKDLTGAVTSMKDEGLDVQRGIKPKSYVELQENERFLKLYNLHQPVVYSYAYLGFNTKNPKLEDKLVRRAVAHCVDVDEIIDVLYYGLAERTVSPIHPTKAYYNDQLTPIPFDLEKAKALLEEAGWRDNNGDGVREKEIDGVETPLILEFKYNTENDIRKNIGLLFQENAKKAGMQVEIVGREWTVFLEDTKKRDFEITCLGWVQGPSLDDLKQIWHTSSDTYDGSNRIGFGNAETDALIDEIRGTIDETKRNELYMKIQEIIYDEQPYVFLYTPKNLMAIHGRFDAESYVVRPGYFETTFQLNSGAKETAGL